MFRLYDLHRNTSRWTVIDSTVYSNIRTVSFVQSYMCDWSNLYSVHFITYTDTLRGELKVTVHCTCGSLHCRYIKIYKMHMCFKFNNIICLCVFRVKLKSMQPTRQISSIPSSPSPPSSPPPFIRRRSRSRSRSRLRSSKQKSLLPGMMLKANHKTVLNLVEIII